MLARNRIKHIIAGVITITGVIVFTFTIIPAVFYVPNNDSGVSVPVGKIATTTTSRPEVSKVLSASNVYAANTETVSVPDNYPALLLIPKISVRAHVQYVGITSKGMMAVPSNFTDVAWYKDGVIPGSVGTAVIDGHLDDGLGLPAVFWSLSKLSSGDEIDIITKDKKTLRFAVSEINLYDNNDPQAPSEIFSQSDKTVIRLITCDGTWSQDQKTYSKRLVVSAELMNS